MKEQKGITLVALIITIIVMLILVAVTVGVLVNSNLIENTNTATNEWKKAEDKEQSLGTGTVYGNEEDGNAMSIQDYIDKVPTN